MFVWVRVPPSLPKIKKIVYCGVFIYMDEIKVYFCVDKHQLEADSHHADWERIKASSRDKAKYEYAKRTKIKYVDCIARLACYDKKY